MSDLESVDIFESVDINEAAKFLGFKSTSRLAQKAKRGMPGAFKSGKKWMFLKVELIAYAYRLNRELREKNEAVNKKRTCPLAKRKAAPIGTRGLQSPDVECRNRLAAHLAQKRKSTRKKGAAK